MSLTTTHIDVLVRFSCGAYVCRANGKSASSTMSDDTAAERLGTKVFGAAFAAAHRLPREAGDDSTGITRWRLEARSEP